MSKEIGEGGRMSLSSALLLILMAAFIVSLTASASWHARHSMTIVALRILCISFFGHDVLREKDIS